MRQVNIYPFIFFGGPVSVNPMYVVTMIVQDRLTGR